MASPLNSVLVTVVTYEYLIRLPLSERPRLTTRRQARGLLLVSCTPSTACCRLRPTNLDTTQFPLAAMTGESSTPHQIWSHLTWLRGVDHQLKRINSWHDLYKFLCPTSTVTDMKDHDTCLPDLTHPFAPTQHTSRTPETTWEPPIPGKRPERRLP
jgi:hypothetical protein